jgi:aspartyl-tRNA(Asn)/glutamyl-tRNA(Gln) amidotransferase subunit A
MPAAVCGIAGLKPTYGRVSRAGVLDLSWSCDHVGPMTRRVSDTAYMMSALAGHDRRDPACSAEPVPDFAAALGRGLDGIRIGVPRDYFFEDVDPQIEAAVREAISVMERNGASVIEVAMPWVARGRQINLGILLPEAVSVHERWLKEHRDQYSPEVRTRLESGIGISALDYIRAQRARRLFNDQMAEATRGLDVLVTPTVPIGTPTIEACTPGPGETQGRAGGTLGNFTGVFDVTGTPSLNVTCGFTDDGMPIGMMISGKPFAEVNVMRVGDAYESIAGWWRRRPPL